MSSIWCSFDSDCHTSTTISLKLWRKFVWSLLHLLILLSSLLTPFKVFQYHFWLKIYSHVFKMKKMTYDKKCSTVSIFQPWVSGAKHTLYNYSEPPCVWVCAFGLSILEIFLWFIEICIEMSSQFYP